MFLYGYLGSIDTHFNIYYRAYYYFLVVTKIRILFYGFINQLIILKMNTV